ncbi:MMPL family transporter [Ornithinicoccus halotolerans]|uniref:MMPL family transporter n=1 Tax=Ornithinicoccus halotolerans TaxID=1748220 RepID=UPI002B202507|nr:MMPL family transporter [Ornithinicoccus halotolerans]
MSRAVTPGARPEALSRSARVPSAGPSRGRHRPVREPFLARHGRVMARRRRWVLVAWLLAVVASFVTSLGLAGGPSLFDRLSNGDITAPGQALTARDLLSGADEEGAAVVVRVDDAAVTDPALAADVAALAEDLTVLPEVTSARAPMTTPGWPEAPEAYALVAEQDPASRSFVVVATLDPDLTTSGMEQAAEQVAALAAPALSEHGQVRVGGSALLFTDIVHQIEQDLVTGEAIALPISLLVMVVVFGGVLAAGMPLLGAVASVGGALVMLLGFSYALELDASVVNIVTVMGLALCIDYGLLLVSRYREEVRRLAPGVAHRDLSRGQVEDAVAVAVASAGRTVLFSGLIVAISLSGLALVPAPIMRAIAAAGVSVVLVALLVALTLVPALCALAARRLGRRRGAEVAPDEGWFSRLARLVQRRPALTTLVSVVLLVLAALPALDLRLTASAEQLLPAGAEQRVFAEDLAEDYPALAFPAVTVVAQEEPQQVADWVHDEVGDHPGVTAVTDPQQHGPPPPGVTAAALPDRELVEVHVQVDGGVQGDTAREVTAALRAAAGEAGFPVWVGGQASSLADFTEAVAGGGPWAALWIVGATFVLLFLLTGSVVIPVKALLLNIVSLGASLGILVWVFQQGHLEQLLGFTSVGGIESVIPLLVLAFGFGLAMDYELFLLSRIIELHEQGLDDDTAVRLGLQRSGRIITSAALVMVIVFAGFAMGDMLVIQETGFALALAVAIDATLVRMVIVPATMTMLGRWNWWAPRYLRRAHERFGITEHSPRLAARPQPAADAR